MIIDFRTTNSDGRLSVHPPRLFSFSNKSALLPQALPVHVLCRTGHRARYLQYISAPPPPSSTLPPLLQPKTVSHQELLRGPDPTDRLPPQQPGLGFHGAFYDRGRCRTIPGHTGTHDLGGAAFPRELALWSTQAGRHVGWNVCLACSIADIIQALVRDQRLRTAL